MGCILVRCGDCQDPREPVSAPVSARGPMEAPRASHREGASRDDSKKRREARAPGSAEKPAFVSKAEFHILEEKVCVTLSFCGCLHLSGTPSNRATFSMKMREMRKFYRLLLRQEISKRERAVIKMQAVARGYLVSDVPVFSPFCSLTVHFLLMAMSPCSAYIQEHVYIYVYMCVCV
mgnify:CR=1 FL=1